MIAKGEFDVALEPREDDGFDAGRMTITKTFRGDLDASSQGQMMSHRTAVTGSAGYVAIEKVSGSLQGKQGSFYLQHFGLMNRGAQTHTIEVIPDSATDELVGLKGNLTITIDAGKHFYEFQYSLEQ